MQNNEEQLSDQPLQISHMPWYKRRKLLVPLVIVILIIAGVVAYLVIAQIVSNQTKKSDGLASSTSFKSPEELVAKAKINAIGQTLETSSSTGLGGLTIDGYGTYGVASYKVGNRHYANLPTKSSGVGYKGDGGVESDNYDLFVSFFDKNKFKLVSSGSNMAGPLSYSDEQVNYISYATYESSNMLCMIWHVDATTTPIGKHIASIGCADKVDYSDAAKDLDKYYTAYANDSKKSTEELVIGFPYVEDGASGYKHAVLFMKDPSLLDGKQSEGLFYKSPNDSKWHYFTNSHGILDCAVYNTAVLRKAFTNLPCDKGTEQIKVAP